MEHPIVDSLSVRADDAVQVGRSLDGAPQQVQALARALQTRTTVATVGRLDGEPEYVFGQVVDAELLGDGSIAILDGQAKELRIFDPDGTHRHTLGGEGEGPGELEFPVSVVSPSPDQLWIVDGGQAVHRFATEADEWEFKERARLDGFPKDACVSDGSVIVHVPSRHPELGPGDVLTDFDVDLTERSHFARPYRYDVPIVAHRMNRGFVTCATGRSVLLGLEFQNRLDAYGVSDGSLRWHASFEGVRSPPTVEERRPDGRTSVQVDILRHAYSHILLNVAGGDGAPVAVQYGRREAADLRERIDRVVIETFAVDPETGQGGYLSDALPLILRLTETHVVLLHEDPHPRVEVARLGPP